MNKREAAIISAYTGIKLGELSDTYEYIEELLGRPIWTHELRDTDLWAEIKEAAKLDLHTIKIED